jgi:tetratricopeptide (TPR) repeat protein
MLHSFWFDAAEREFAAIAAADETCAMAHWGRAIAMMGNPMTRAAPGAEPFAAGADAIARAQELAPNASHREQMYIDAAVAYYAGAEDADHATRMRRMEEKFAALHQAHPEDPEAALFHGRTMVANAPPADTTFAALLAAAMVMEPVAEAHPDHPGVLHYLIHAYDVPQLASRAREAAFAYADVAPAAPHALHMPSHIFTRLGYWDESIETNARSAQAEPVPDAAVHPMDYMVYAYLQQGRDAEAGEVVARAVQNSDRHYGGLLGYNFTAMPARYALERAAWAEAATLRIPVGALPYVEAVTRFARAIGAARSGDGGAAQMEVEALGVLQAKLADAGDAYWSTIVEAQRLAAAAWTAHAAGDHAEAEQLARAAADLEETVEKHPVTPGPLLPARELLGDLLLAHNKPAEALAAYRATLRREPRRARTLFGAARAAQLAGEREASVALYQELLEVMARADDGRPEVAQARKVVGSR